MSTKTTLKRIALVAVSALGFGLLSVAPSNAAVQSDALTLGVTASTTTVGVAATNTIGLTFIDDNGSTGSDTVSATVVVLSSPSTSTAVPVLADATAAATNGTRSGAGTFTGVLTSTASAVARVSGGFTLSLTPDVAGTYVVRVTPGGGAINTTAQTWTITASTALAVTAANSTSFIVAGETSTASADATITVPLTVNNDAQKATVVVTPRTAGDIAPVAAVALTATISGPGTLGIGNAAGVANIVPGGRAVTGTAGHYMVAVFSDGTAGVATVTISVGTTVISTETVTFYGAAASITPTVVNAVIPASSSGAAVGAITAIVRDAAGVPVAGTRVYDVSSATTIISDNYGDCGESDATGKVTCNLTGAAAGTANITLTTNSAATVTTGISAAPVSIRVGSASPATVRLSFDKATYVPGEKATVTVTLLDATGLPVVNGTYANTFTAAGVTSSLALASGSLPTASVATTGSTGTATYTVNMPLVAGTVTLTGTGDTSIATAGRVAVTATATVTGGEAAEAAAAAADAAAEAIDAANAATDAANLAAEAADAATVAAEEARDAADAATAAVEELATQVATLMAALKAQITTLANTVAKIAKKVRA